MTERGAERSDVNLDPRGCPHTLCSVRYFLTIMVTLMGCGDSGPPPDPTHGIVINEVAALGNEFVELYNPTSVAVDLTGYIIADGQGRNEPRRDVAVQLEEGTTLGPGEYLVVITNLGDAALPGLQTICGTDGPPTCYHASWGVGVDGDTIFLDAQNERPTTIEYPSNAVPEGQSWGRIPNGSGELVPNLPTPGRENMAIDPLFDGGFDAALDAGTDAGTDAGEDAETDAGADAGVDAAPDAPSDAAADTAPTDAAVDVPPDAFDAGT